MATVLLSYHPLLPFGPHTREQYTALLAQQTILLIQTKRSKNKKNNNKNNPKREAFHTTPKVHRDTLHKLVTR